MTDTPDTSPEAVPVDTSTSRISKLQELGCADYIHAALASERDALSARVAELGGDYRKGFDDGCAHMKEDYEAGKRLMTNKPDTSPEAVEHHLSMNHNHEAGLIPMGTQIFIRAQAARVAELEAELDTAKQCVMRNHINETIQQKRAEAAEAKLARLADAVTHQREMVCQDMGMQMEADKAVDDALAETTKEST